jgi:hypothetical protein
MVNGHWSTGADVARQGLARDMYARMWRLMNQGGRNFDWRVAARPPSDGGVLGGPEQLGIWAIELGGKGSDWTAVSAAEQQKPVAAAETSGGACGSVEAPMGLFSTALARWSPKVSIGI